MYEIGENGGDRSGFSCLTMDVSGRGVKTCIVCGSAGTTRHDSPRKSQASLMPLATPDSSTMSRIGMRRYLSNERLSIRPSSSLHSMATLRMRLMPILLSTSTSSREQISGPRNRKDGRTVETMNGAIAGEAERGRAVADGSRSSSEPTTRLTSPNELGEGGTLDCAWQRVWKDEPKGVFGAMILSPGDRRLDSPTLMESLFDPTPDFRGSGGRLALRNGLSRLRLSFGGRRAWSLGIDIEGRAIVPCSVVQSDGMEGRCDRSGDVGLCQF